ncbi:EH_Signature domain-containing protein [Sphingobium faniae]|nr:EH_Signature domain-containing protein [Sphingobium faniae]
MTALRNAIARMHSTGAAGFPRSPSTQPEIQKQLRHLDLQVGEVESVEELRPFLERSSSRGASALRRFELNRVLRGAWCDEIFDTFGAEAVERADRDCKRSSDQALIEGYLTHFPSGRPVIRPLAAAARRAADRHVWAWRQRSDAWTLFDPESGPSRVGNALASAAAGEAGHVLSEVGIGHQVAATRFGRAAFVAACNEIADLRGGRATSAQSGLLKLFDIDRQASDLPELVRALLEPWVTEKPDREHRKALSEFLMDQVGDPRIAPRRWEHILAELARTVGAERAVSIVQVLKRWLTDVAMREFFRAIAKTTDRPDQWKQRSAFWLAYLDEGLVTDAWPALGQRARHNIEEIIRRSGERPEFGVMQGGPASSSTIIMQIGDLRIAEWSDNGSCRFWRDTDPRSPRLYEKVYDGGKLRTTDGRKDFEYHSHVPSPGWEAKFAGIIHRRTGVLHPVLGRGRASNWNDTW